MKHNSTFIGDSFIDDDSNHSFLSIDIFQYLFASNGRYFYLVVQFYVVDVRFLCDR